MSNSRSSEDFPSQSSLSSITRIEWQTVVLALVIYGGFLGLTWFWQSLPLAVVIALGGWLIAWHGSLQHEVIHGHPTRNRSINDAIGWPPLSLWLPYAIYREGHLTHHRDEHLTDPIEDPESSYLTQAAWDRLGLVGRSLARWNSTLFGRLTLGPLVMIVSFLAQEAALLLEGDRARSNFWIRHAIGVAAVLVWVIAVCGMPLWLYLFGFVYVGAALTRLRSYAEHRYADHHDERTAIVENSTLFGLLFLYNNLHVLHHQRPGVPWYRIPALYQRHKQTLVLINGGLIYDGYLDVARRYFFRPHDDLRHPLHRSSSSMISNEYL
ncbi:MULTISPECIES: fatty acid desaturase [unclassified Ensifer]|uniref:fatty acid desaturase n=1 Tax=unclassified Ensifer TaxID=2633371 RepID=UPI0007133558|nr:MULTISPECIES: fatty acid desaturase [unclassified Ensifer]KQX51248.1 fatty acid desaturase [Ensifer sp. Root1298]KQX80389.1 fatty acid desaturase [Ensifer sp. Root1312]KRC18895.1 fatty acid desaturase [Ensifer sp. Root74]KRD75386.1 fatty acid desaturase [Ensifer sp. Root954]